MPVLADPLRLHRFPPPDHSPPGHVQPPPEHVHAAGPVYPTNPKTCRRWPCFVNSHNAWPGNLLKWAVSVCSPIWNDSLLTFPRLHPVQFWAWAGFKGGPKLKREGGRFTSGDPKTKGGEPLCSTIPTLIHHSSTALPHPFHVAFACTSPA